MDSTIYPAIVACINQGRQPTLGEVRRVASRIQREAFPQKPCGPGARRPILRAALTALGGSNEADGALGNG